MCTVHVGIGHDDDLVITQFGNIKIFMDSCTKCSDHRLDLGIAVDLIQSCLLYVQDLTTQWKDCLRRTVTCCLRRTAGGISLYDVDLAVLRILIRTVCKLSRKCHIIQC